VPSNYGLGLDDDEAGLPARPAAGEDDPEGPIERGEPGTRRLGCVGRELLAEGELDDRLLALAPEEGGDDSYCEHRVADQNSDHVEILRQVRADIESDSESEAGISSVVERLVAARRKPSCSGPIRY
jgi:hypothetical protein